MKEKIWTNAFGTPRCIKRMDVVDRYLAFREELRGALRTQSPTTLRACFKRWGPDHPEVRGFIRQPDSALELAIRQMILEEPALAELHADARAWLWRHLDATTPRRAA